MTDIAHPKEESLSLIRKPITVTWTSNASQEIDCRGARQLILIITGDGSATLTLEGSNTSGGTFYTILYQINTSIASSAITPSNGVFVYIYELKALPDYLKLVRSASGVSAVEVLLKS